MNVDLVLAAEPAALWPFVAGGIGESLAYAQGEIELGDVAALVDSGVFSLWVIETDDSRFLGVLVTEMNNGAAKRWLNVVAAFVSPGADELAGVDVLGAALVGLEEYAATQDAGLRAFSVRPGMERRLKRLGWRRRFVEYVKEH